jgi:hypothetical protein
MRAQWPVLLRNRAAWPIGKINDLPTNMRLNDLYGQTGTGGCEAPFIKWAISTERYF